MASPLFPIMFERWLFALPCSSTLFNEGFKCLSAVCTHCRGVSVRYMALFEVGSDKQLS